MNLLLNSCQQMGKKSENWKKRANPRNPATAPLQKFFIIAIQPFYGCQRNAHKNITITVSVRVSVTVRVSLV